MIDEAQAAFFDQCVDKAIHDGRVRAVVLRVDSGGGLVGPSDEMWRNVKRLKDHGLYVVASYGSVAASGGYYMSVAADEIFAQPTSITGSIGVMGSVWTFQGLLQDKLGITPETITATGSPEKDVANNLFRNWTDKDRTEIRRIIDAMYARFAEVVVAGRSDVLSEEEARALCTGKVFMADEAKQVKLIDEVGYLDDAVAAAAGGANLRNPTVEQYDLKAGVMEMLTASANPTGGVGVELDSRAVRKLVTELGMPRMMYLYQP
jgi:protease-4